MERMEENILVTCAEWLLNRRQQLLSGSETCSKTLFEVPIDETILLEALVMMAKARDTGLMFYKDAMKSELHGVKEHEMDKIW